MARKRTPSITSEKLLAQLKDRITNVKNTFEFKAWLTCLSKFHKYSWRNRMLILMQNPDATKVMGYTQWKQVGRQVKAGEKGIKILRPNPKKIKKDDGEEGMIMYFKITTVFDISQTEGDALPTLDICTYQDEGKQYIPGLLEYAKRQGIDVTLNADIGSAFGVSKMGSIELKAGAPSDIFSTLVHELAHEEIHTKEERIKGTKQQKEFEAESVAFVVCITLGVPTTSDKYLATYPDYDLMKSLKVISDCAEHILDAIQADPIELVA